VSALDNNSIAPCRSSTFTRRRSAKCFIARGEWPAVPVLLLPSDLPGARSGRLDDCIVCLIVVKRFEFAMNDALCCSCKPLSKPISHNEGRFACWKLCQAFPPHNHEFFELFMQASFKTHLTQRRSVCVLEIVSSFSSPQSRVF